MPTDFEIQIGNTNLTHLQIAERNRGCYRKLRAELESLTESGICLNKKLLMSGASVMQRLTVEMLCNQLDNTWKYFTATFKMQAESQLGFHFILSGVELDLSALAHSQCQQYNMRILLTLMWSMNNNISSY